jgi:uncharacterized glyoxalase superfamily protein PhnB
MSKQPLDEQLDQAISEILVNPAVLPVSGDPSLEDLIRMAADLRDIPRPDFKTRLKTDLERMASMSTATKTVAFRSGFRTLRAPSGPGAFHAEVRIGDSMLMIGTGPEIKDPRPATLHVFVPNADETYRRALEAGAVSTVEMNENYGERFGCVRHATGNTFIIATHLGADYVQPNLRTVTLFLTAAGASRLVAHDGLPLCPGCGCVVRARDASRRRQLVGRTEGSTLW